MMPRRGMTIAINIYIWFLYDDSYEGFHLDFASFTHVITSFVGFTYVIRWWLCSYEVPMDELIKRSHMCLIYIWCAPVVDGVAGVSTTTNLGWNGDATVSSRGLPRSTPMSSSIYYIWWFYDIKTNTYYVLNVYMYYDKEHWCSLTSPWLGIARESLSQSGMFLKESYYPQARLISWDWFILCWLYYILIYNLFSTSSSLNLVGFRLLLLSLSMWFCSLPHFSPLSRLSLLLYLVLCWLPLLAIS